jgi:hypothetical protein
VAVLLRLPRQRRTLGYGTFTVNAIWSDSATGLSVNGFTSSWLALQFGLFGWYRKVTMPAAFE